MLIIGAKGHAKEILEILIKQNNKQRLLFYDDISTDLPKLLYDKYKIIRTIDEVKREFLVDNRFILGLGNPQARYALALKFISIGGILESLISSQSNIGSFNVDLGKGINIMTGVFISNDVKIGEGSLLNTNCTIHHDTEIGRYCGISPGVYITGGCKIGNFCVIGTGAIILPKITVGNNVIIGAGALVSKNIPSNVLAAGMPAKIIRKNKQTDLT